MTEYAEGIPSKVVEPVRPVSKEGHNEMWWLSVSEHEADKAGKHFDVRLVDPDTDQAHSWAVPQARWPEGGEKLWAIPQPTHTGEYAKKKGKWRVESEYGKGTVKSKILEPVEVIEAGDNKITFNRFPGGQKVENISLIKLKDGALVFNHSPIGRTVGKLDIPNTKKKYKEIEYGALNPDDDDEVFQAKIDGSHVVLGLQAHKPVRVFSYRDSKKLPIIEHTSRFEDWHRKTVPAGFGGTVVRAEGWASDKDGKAVPVQEVASLFNSGILDAKKKVKDKGLKMRLSLLDVDKFRGRDMSDRPYEDKLPILKKLVDKIPGLELPPTAEDKESKKKLIKDIRDGKLKETAEGIVVHNKKTNTPIKAKLSKDYDGKVVGVFEGKGKYKNKGVGGLYVKEENSGKKLRVGSGLKDRLRKILHDNPKLLNGVIVKMKASGQYPSGALRMPRFKGMHPDKNDPAKMEELLKLKVAEKKKSILLRGLNSKKA